MGNKSTVKNWCWLRDNSELRMVIKLRLKSHNTAALCRQLDLDRMNFQHYLDGSQPRSITQYDLWRMCGKIGVKLELKLTLE